jgi:hypothetical protein
MRLCRSPVSLLRIAIDASQHTVRPRRQTTLGTRDNVVNRELFAARLLSTVLVTHLVTLEYVSAAEGNLLCRHRIELSQCDDFRNTDTLAYRLDDRLVAIRYHSAPVAPVIQLVIDRVDNLGRIVPQHDQGTRSRRHVDRLPVTVQKWRVQESHLAVRAYEARRCALSYIFFWPQVANPGIEPGYRPYESQLSPN